MSSFRRCFTAFVAVCMIPAAGWGAWLLWGPGAPAGRRAMMFWACLSAASIAAAAAAAREVSREEDAAVKSLQKRLWANEELYLNEKAKFDTLLSNLPDGIVITNLRGDVLYINDAAMTALRVRREDVIEVGKDSKESIRQERVRYQVQDILEKRTAAEVVEIAIEGPEGPTPRYYQVSVALFSITSDKNIGVMVILRDRTLDRQISLMKDEFFTTAAHDLRAPLAAIQGYVRLVEKRTPRDEKNQIFFDSIYKSCDKLMLFVRDILDAGRLEAGRLALQIRSVQVAALFQGLKTLYGPVADEKGIRIELQLPSTALVLEGDERLLERVFHNLISNALKITPRGGVVRLVAAEAGAEELEFSVADTGPGIPQELRPLAFEKFGPLASGRSRGFGLGLHIVRGIVELHGGKIWVGSEEGRGSEFVFRLPKARVGAAASAAST